MRTNLTIKIHATGVTSYLMLVFTANIGREVCVKTKKKNGSETKNLINDNKDILKGDTFTHNVFESFASVTDVLPYFL